MSRNGVGLTLAPRKYESGETDVTGRISNIGDHEVRVVLYGAANDKRVIGDALRSRTRRRQATEAAIATKP